MASRFKSPKDYFNEVKKVHHNKYEYDENDYIRLSSKIAVFCSKHGKFTQSAHDHLSGHGCSRCHRDKTKTWTEEQDEFLRKNYHMGSFWCAGKLGKTSCAIHGRAQKLKIADKQEKINPNIPATFWNSVKSRVSEDKMELDFDSDFVWGLYQKQGGKCALTGRPIKFVHSKSTKETTVSLDRIDSKKDYLKGNVQLTHKLVNRCKLNCPEDVFFSICKDVYLHGKDKFEHSTIEWQMDVWNDREIPVLIKKAADYDNLNFAEFKREKP